MKLTHFYHAFLYGELWEGIAQEHAAAIRAADLHVVTRIGAVGTLTERVRIGGMIPNSEVVNGGYEGWEQATLHPLYIFACNHPGQAILYCHMKGASHPKGGSNAWMWRRAMTKLLVGGWRENLAKIEEGYDAVGAYWITHDAFPEQAGWCHDGFFAGNFWMASTDFIATLGHCDLTDRWAPEKWLTAGECPPRVYDLQPGWPDEPLWKEVLAR